MSYVLIHVVDKINNEFPGAHVASVIGGSVEVYLAVRNNVKSLSTGMAIQRVHWAKNDIAMNRGKDTTYGWKYTLFYADSSCMLYGGE